jgi:hypothetical protein
MTSDSKLFPPRPVWESWGYRPDEYSRWIKGPWKPIAQLWEELGVETGNGEQGTGEAIPGNDDRSEHRFPVSGAPAPQFPVPADDVQATAWRVRCAQPPYDTLPIPRADIPPGIILCRNADAWIREEEIPIVTFTDASGKPLTIKEGRGKEAVERQITGPAIALPLYEGRMIGQFDFSEKGWVSGKGRSAVWRQIPSDRKVIEPQYLMGMTTYQWNKLLPWLCENFEDENDRSQALARYLAQPHEMARWWLGKPDALSFMDICSATNMRTMYGAFTVHTPNGHSAPKLFSNMPSDLLAAVVNSFTWDHVARLRTTGLHLVWAVLNETPLPPKHEALGFLRTAARPLSLCNPLFALPLVTAGSSEQDQAKRARPALTEHERLRRKCIVEALVAESFGSTPDDLKAMFDDCHYPQYLSTRSDFTSKLDAKGFWRVDRNKPPEHRLTVLSLVAFHDLQEKIETCSGDVYKGIEAFCTQNDGEGWMLPETLRLADYGLGHDDRALESQPVRECLGPRFYDWQLAQSPEESWRECHLHARNLLGEAGYQQLLAEIEGRDECDGGATVAEAREDVERDLFGSPVETDLFGQPIRNSKKRRRR